MPSPASIWPIIAIRFIPLVFAGGMNVPALGAPPSVPIPAELFQYAQDKPIIGGSPRAQALLILNGSLLRRLAASTQEIIDAQLSLPIHWLDREGLAATLLLHTTSQDLTRTETASPLNLQKKDRLARSPSLTPDINLVTIGGLGPALRTLWRRGTKPSTIVLTVVSNSSNHPPPRIKLQGAPKTLLRIRSQPKHTLYDHPIQPTEGVYVHRQGSRLRYGDQRLRLWGVASTASASDAMGRVHRLGFNAIRLWPGGGNVRENPFYNGVRGPETELPPSVLVDRYDRNVAAAKKAGLFIMSPFLASSLGVKSLRRSDSIVAGGDDWKAWRQATQLAGAFELAFAATFDNRLFRAHHQHILNVLNHRNPYTGKRYAEEEAIAIWELGNEQGWVKKALETGFAKWTPYFRTALTQRWTTWLTARYKTTKQLQAAWGELRPSEHLDKGGVIALTPTFEQRRAYPEARGDDLVRFVIELVSEFYQRLEKIARAQAPAGVGVAVVPFSYDTQYRPNTPWHFSTAGFADVASFGMYFWQMQSTLTRPPSMYVMDTQTVAGKPTIIYETNAGRPNPFRVEHPFRTAVLASWQDWDAIFWHYYHLLDWPDEQYLAAHLPYGTPDFYWAAVETERDPAMLSALGLAGQIFLREHLQASTNPIRYRVGAQGLFGYRRWHGVGSARATFKRGAQIDFHPTANLTDVELESANENTYREEAPKSAVRSGPEILWDWPNGRLIVDAPRAKLYIGRPPPRGQSYQFNDGIAVGNFTTEFVAFACVSANDRPLVGRKASQHWYLNARFNAQNTGFVTKANASDQNSGPVAQARAVSSHGGPPILETPVTFTLTLPFPASGSLSGYDFATRKTFRKPFRNLSRLHLGKEALLNYEITFISR
ncbi:MAG: beta-galactosidase [Myxococcales bacterium]|nr:beta-galactosidase [Myxococcales bacterium]